ncbi:hypothetical protein [Streptomyces sp. NPDC093071]|uniref:hypothetical protein n=1 Tax=Streptomyces sp. NPDC093071 TaxID=3366022 RepID=UPI0037FC2ADA
MSGKNKQNVAKTVVFTDGDGRLPFCSPTKPGSCADITHARESGLVKLLADGQAVEILAGAGHRGPGAQTGGRVVTPPHRKFKKNDVQSPCGTGPFLTVPERFRVSVYRGGFGSGVVRARS